MVLILSSLVMFWNTKPMYRKILREKTFLFDYKSHSTKRGYEWCILDCEFKLTAVLEFRQSGHWFRTPIRREIMGVTNPR